MSKCIILRYSDYDDVSISTIEEHCKILKTHGKVFWGWWKKEFEIYPKQEIEKYHISKKVWLVERKQKKFFCAEYNEIYTFEEAKVSPDTKLTPPYYSKEAFYVWFEFHKIYESNEGTFLSECHQIPSGDKTLFLSWKISKFPQTNFEQVKGASILHISDLHFGEFFAYYPTIINEPTLIEKVKCELEKHKIGIIVISGDLVTKGDKKNFAEAKDFIDELVDICKVKKNQIVMVPGNHDLNLPQGGINPKMPNNYEVHYREFRKQLLGIEKEKDIQFIKTFELVDTGWKLTFTCFNSTRQLDKSFKDYGYIGSDMFNILLKQLQSSLKIKTKNGETKQENYIENKILNFSVIHHHLTIPVPPQIYTNKIEPIGILIDGRMFEEALMKSGIHFLLHGHQHIRYYDGSSIIDDKTGKRINLNIISAGSLGANIGGKGGGYPIIFPHNSFSVYTPDDGFLRENVYTFGPGGKNVVLNKKYKIPYLS